LASTTLSILAATIAFVVSGYPNTEPKVDLFGSILKAAGGVLMKFGKLSVFFLVLLDFGSDHGECLTINDVW